MPRLTLEDIRRCVEHAVANTAPQPVVERVVRSVPAPDGGIVEVLMVSAFGLLGYASAACRWDPMWSAELKGSVVRAAEQRALGAYQSMGSTDGSES